MLTMPQTVKHVAAILALASFGSAQPVVTPTPDRPDEIAIGFTFIDFAYGIQADNITGRNRVTLRNNIQRRTNYGFWISGDD